MGKKGEKLARKRQDKERRRQLTERKMDGKTDCKRKGHTVQHLY